MKKSILCILAAVLCLTFALPANASDDSLAFDNTPVPVAVDAFNAFSGENNLTLAQTTTSEILDEVMVGAYNVQATDQAAAQRLAPALTKLTAITSLDMVNYANANTLPREQVRNAYYRALANVLRAEIMVNPASETRYQNIQTILTLFLNGDSTDEVISETRKVIRQSMTPQHAATIAADYNLPAAFVEFVIMDDDWDNDDWTDDHHWIAEGGYVGTDDYLATDDYVNSDRNRASAKPAATPKPAQKTYHSSDHNSPDYDHSYDNSH